MGHTYAESIEHIEFSGVLLGSIESVSAAPYFCRREACTGHSALLPLDTASLETGSFTSIIESCTIQFFADARACSSGRERMTWLAKLK